MNKFKCLKYLTKLKNKNKNLMYDVIFTLQVYVKILQNWQNCS